ncbi:cytochrome P450 [Macrolepiota fuliginosa MF-IS2]|uniref:Cytochrome P450 n=1 Tax=Macrolepiota fuliginosa MF-IS2 TaxID=1400762 RepID=A0A9P5X4F6_9AGAR|nr:cytochrome P450 [Macrolepiota fuliginosa MF-IS2]
MDFSSIPSIFTLVALSALCAHVYFHRNEDTSVRGSILFLLVLPSLHTKFLLNYYPALQATLTAFSLYYVVLFTSIIAYRLSPFHPLYKYPGPLCCRITKWTTAQVALLGETHRWVRDLHRRYGPIVRTGPNELSIIDKDMIPFILGSQGMPRGPLWDGRLFGEKDGKVYDSLITLRNQEEHAKLRKHWNRAFAAAPVKGYEVLLVRRMKQLVQGLEKACRDSPNEVGKIDLAKWVSYLAYDFMGDLAFNGVFNLLVDGDSAGLLKGMYDAMVLPSITQHIPWILPFLRSLPVVNAGMSGFIDFAEAQVKQRLSKTPKHPDLFHYMIEAAEEADSGMNPESLILQNSLLAIVAGSDTTASILSNVFYYLMRYPDYYKHLQEEIDGALDGSGSVEADRLTNLAFLNAVLNETLRLQPAVPTYLNRAPAIGSGGRGLSTSMFIPEGTAVFVSPYTIHRDPRYFSPRPDDFWPERWVQTSAKTPLITDDKEPFILARDAFIPFSVGPANCAGKPIALIEMRLAIANTVRRFDMAFDDDFDPDQWERELLDRFVIVKGQLNVALRLRRL